MRLPPYSTSTANPQSFVTEGVLPKASYKIVTRLTVCVWENTAHKMSTKARNEPRNLDFIAAPGDWRTHEDNASSRYRITSQHQEPVNEPILSAKKLPFGAAE